MSKAERRLRKEKNKTRKYMGSETINCPNCGTPAPNSIFLKGDMGRSYNCAICGRNVYTEWVEKVFNKVN